MVVVTLAAHAPPVKAARLEGPAEEDDKGTLEIGQFADMAVLDQDALMAPEDALPGIRAHLVIVGGEVALAT